MIITLRGENTLLKDKEVKTPSAAKMGIGVTHRVLSVRPPAQLRVEARVRTDKTLWVTPPHLSFYLTNSTQGGLYADDLQEIILMRYAARKSTLITSNRVIDDWGKCLGDNAIASAILDRILHHGNLLKFEGQSYRLKEANMRLAKNTAID